MQTTPTPPATDSVEQVLDGRIHEIVDVALTAHKQEVAVDVEGQPSKLSADDCSGAATARLDPPPIRSRPPRASTGQR